MRSASVLSRTVKRYLSSGIFIPPRLKSALMPPVMRGKAWQLGLSRAVWWPIWCKPSNLMPQNGGASQSQKPLCHRILARSAGRCNRRWWCHRFILYTNRTVSSPPMQRSKPAVQRRNAASTFLGEHGCHPPWKSAHRGKQRPTQC